MWRQFDLASDDTRMTCWIIDDRRLRVGRTLSLKDDPRVWIVAARYATTLDSPPLKEWRVGGLL